MAHSTLATFTEAPLTAGGTGEDGATLRLTFINCKAKKMEKPTKENA